MRQLSSKQKEFWLAPPHRWNIKHGATRTGKTYLDYFMIPRRIRERAGLDGLVVLIGNTKGTLQRNVIDPMIEIYGSKMVSSIRSDNTAEMFGEKLDTRSSYYVNNANRTENLRLACEAINGTIINPGEVFSFNKIRGLDAYLSPEMKSTGEAIGYDDDLYRAFYKALQASGMHLQNYGTVLVTLADRDKEEALPLIRRFYNLGFNIEATSGTARFLKEHGIRTRTKKKISEGSNDITESIRAGHIAYVINTSDLSSSDVQKDGYEIRHLAIENNISLFTSLDTVRILLDVLEEITLTISTIDA